MRNCPTILSLSLILLTGCTAAFPWDPEKGGTAPDHPVVDNRTRQVPVSPFAEPKKPAPARVSYPPATQETSYRVLLIKDRLLEKNQQLGLKPYAVAIGSPDPEIFHVGNTIHVTEGLVRQCGTDQALAAVLSFELGRMVAARESSIADEIRQPERPLPIHLPIGGNSYGREADPLNHIELAQYEKQNPRKERKLARPDPQHVARTILENAGYQRTELDAVLPLLANAERNSILENQFKGTGKQSDWKAP